MESELTPRGAIAVSESLHPWPSSRDELVARLGGVDVDSTDERVFAFSLPYKDAWVMTGQGGEIEEVTLYVKNVTEAWVEEVVELLGDSDAGLPMRGEHIEEFGSFDITVARPGLGPSH